MRIRLVLFRHVHMQHDERRAAFALELQKHEILTSEFHGRKIDADARAALRTAHLFANARENLMQ